MRRAQLVAGVVIFAVACVLSVPCLSADRLSREQEECCARMMHRCGDGALRPECCPVVTQQIDVLGAKAAAGFVFTPSSLLAVLEQAYQQLPRPATRSVSVFAASPPGPPIRLLTSVFRI